MECRYNISAVQQFSSSAVQQSLHLSLSSSKNLIRRCLGAVKRRLVRYSRIASDFSRKRDKYCIICGHKVGRFYPYGVSDEIFTRHHIIGGGRRENCICPYCGNVDRNRWQYYVIKNFTGLTTEAGISVLHFAPEPSNSELIKSNPNCTYITADIVPGRADYSADMTNLHQFRDGEFDYVIANHVLEHIQDEAKAFSELKRVLKPNGKLIISFPICTDILTYEDASITTEEGRLKAFGQEDHVRLYGTDFKERIENYGFDVKVYRPEGELSPEAIEKYALIKDDVMMVCSVRE